MRLVLQQILAFLSPRLRWRWLAQVPLAVVGAVVEAFGAASVFALIRVVSEPAQVHRIPGVRALPQWFPGSDDHAVVLALTALVGLFYVVKNVLLGVVVHVQNRLIGDSMAYLSRRLLRGYLSVPYAFHFGRNSSDLVHNISGATETVFRNVLGSLIGTVAEGLVVVAILTVLVATAPMVTLAAGAFFAVLLTVLLRVTQRVVVRWGAEVQERRIDASRKAHEALGGLKEAKVLSREAFFEEAFGRQHDQASRLVHRHATLFNLPRLFIETTFICGTLLIVTLINTPGAEAAETVPLLGLFAYAGFRIIPSANRIMFNLSMARYGIPVVARLHDDFAIVSRYADDWDTRTNGRTLDFRDRLVLHEVSYRYDAASPPALVDIDLTIHRGESVGIVGPTGAGKSTLIDIILGLLPPTTGAITVDGVNIFDALRAWRAKIGYVPQSIYLTHDSLRRNIAFGLRDHEIDDARIRAAAHMAMLDDVIAALPAGLDADLGERGRRLSGGQRQRVAIARALYHEPELLIFDEATSALDNQTEREVTRAIEALQGKKTLVIIAHRLSTVRACDRLVFLSQGRIAGVGPYAELVAHNEEFRHMAALGDAAADRR